MLKDDWIKKSIFSGNTAYSFLSTLNATVVITATTRNDVLILPLSVIAGRQGTGLVTVITPNGERVETKVTLGVTDGANIEILSGLEEGDVVSATPPNLDPRGI